MPKRSPAVPSHSLFGNPEPDAPMPMPPVYRANVDGGSRGNPGPAAYGVVIRDPRGEVIAKLKKYIGRGTNNVAEYYGLIAALDYTQAHDIRGLRVESDSELLVKQMRGQYRVKSLELRPLFEQARKLAAALESFRIEHIPRERNSDADALVNEALDQLTRAATKPVIVSETAVKPEKHSTKGRVVARYQSGALHPIEPLDLPDGSEVEIFVRPVRKT